ncbi:MAG: GFA family protein [Silicimonas sp.]|nr:GFA family protein [Silicimonas sp.]
MRTGGCMCGAVRYEAETDGRFSVCYCKMCQRWSSGVFMGAPTKGVRITEGQDVLTRVRTSDWASRGFCSKCGSNIYYHADAQDHPSIAFGSLDDTSGMEPRIQFFFDKKPDGLGLDRETKTMTEAECVAHFAS